MKYLNFFCGLVFLAGASLAQAMTSEYLVIDNPVTANTTIRVNTGLVGSPCQVRVISNGEIRECPVDSSTNTFEFERDGEKSSGEFSSVQTFKQSYESFDLLEANYKGEMSFGGKKIQVLFSTFTSTATSGATTQRASVRIGEKLTYELK